MPEQIVWYLYYNNNNNIVIIYSHLFHGIDLLVDELGLGQQRIGCCVVFFEFGRQSLGIGQYLLYGDRHRTEAL